MVTTSATSAVAPAEFASSSEEGGRVGAYDQSSSPTGITAAAAALPPEPGMYPGPEERAAENPDGSPQDDEKRLGDELHKVQREIVARRQERKRKLEQQLALARRVLQTEEDEEALRRLEQASHREPADYHRDMQALQSQPRGYTNVHTAATAQARNNDAGTGAMGLIANPSSPVATLRSTSYDRNSPVSYPIIPQVQGLYHLFTITLGTA